MNQKTVSIYHMGLDISGIVCMPEMRNKYVLDLVVEADSIDITHLLVPTATKHFERLLVAEAGGEK